MLKAFTEDKMKVFIDRIETLFEIREKCCLKIFSQQCYLKPSASQSR